MGRNICLFQFASWISTTVSLKCISILAMHNYHTQSKEGYQSLEATYDNYT